MSCFLAFNPANPTLYNKICYNGASYITNLTQQVGPTDSIPFYNSFSRAFDIDTIWILITAALVFCLQTGFTFIQSSFIRENIYFSHVLVKNLLATCISAIVFYIVGYSMAYGGGSTSYNDTNRFMGVENILIEDRTYRRWFFEFMYLAVASTIAASSISQRLTTFAYFIFVICFSAWIYPVIVYWCWSSYGWLSPFSPHPRPFGGLIDFAGSGVVHMVGGFTSIIGVLFLGARRNRFLDNNKSVRQFLEQRECIFGHNVLYHACGILFLWFGWYGFTCGRTLAATNVMQIASKVAVTTTLSAATGGLCVAIFSRIIEGYWSLQRICDGILIGLVAICSPCNVIDPGYAILIGFLASICYYAVMWFLNLIRFDDPMNSFVIHGIGGGFGLLAAGLFATDKTVHFGYATHNVPYLTGASKGHRFATQIVGVLVISIWTMLNCILIFGLMRCCHIFHDTAYDEVPDDVVPTNVNRQGNIELAQEESEEKKFIDDGKK